MFDDFELPSQKDNKSKVNTSKNSNTGMFDDFILPSQKYTKTPVMSTQPTVTEPTTPSVTPEITPAPKKNSFLNTVKSFFNITNPTSGFIPKIAEDSIQKNLIQPILDRTSNTEKGKLGITAYEKGTRGSTSIYATPKAYIETFKDIATGNGKISNYGELFQNNFDEAIDEWDKGGEDPSMSWTKKIARSVLESAPQSAVGVLLNMVPIFGKGLSTAHFATISAAEQINERGQVNSLGNIGVDVIGDQMLGGVVEGLFKKPATDLIKTGFKETVKQTGKGFIVEGTTEPAQTFLKYANDYKNAKSPEERQNIIAQTKDYVKNGGMLLEFLVGGISGAGISTIASLASQSQINPNIPKPKLGLTEDDDKEFTPEQNKIREAFREDIKQDLTNTGFNKPFVARQISKETGIDYTLTSVMVDEISETIKNAQTPIFDIEQASQQALQENGIVLEETKTPEVVTEQPKLKISKEEPLITAAKKFKSAKEFIDNIRGSATQYGEYTPELRQYGMEDYKNISELGVKTDEMVTIYRGLDKTIGKTRKQINDGDFVTTDYDSALSYTGDPKNVIEMQVPAKTLYTDAIRDFTEEPFYTGAEYVYTTQKVEPKTKAELEDIWNKAQGEDTKMKIKESMTDEQRDEVSKLLDGLDPTPLTVNGKPSLEDTELYFRLDQLKTKNEKGKLTNEEYIEAKGLLEESGVGLDTLKTKEDNNKYEPSRKITKGIDGGIQPNREGVRGSDEQTSMDSLEKRQESNIRKNDRNGNETPSKILLGAKKSESEIRQVISDYIPKVTLETINKIVSYYIRLDEAGYSLTLNKEDISDYAFIKYDGEAKYTLTLNGNDIDALTTNTLDHEIGTHIYYPNIGDDSRLDIFNGVKEVYKTNKELFDKFGVWYQEAYWDRFIQKHLTFALFEVNPGTHEEIYKILQETGFVDENNKTIYPEDIMETTFNFSEINDKLNTYLKENNYNTTNRTIEQNNMMAEEIVAYVTENAKEFLPFTTGKLKKYLSGIVEDNLEFPSPNPISNGLNDVFSKLKESTNLTARDIIKKHPDIELKRDITITDVYGNKAVLKQGEGITPYEVTGNKFILQDGEAYLVSKSQAENVMNNSIKSEGKEFAPELKQTEETVISDEGVIKAKNIKAVVIYNNGEYTAPGYNITKNEIGYYDVYDSDGHIVGGNLTDLENIQRAIDAIPKKVTRKNTKYSQYTLPGGTNYKEILIKAPETLKKGEYGTDVIDKTQTFRSSHWSEPNVISHIRMNERTYDGKKVAFMEELQSDWAREGRNKGFEQKISNPESLLPEGWKVTTNGDTFWVVDEKGNKVANKLATGGDVIAYGGTKEVAIGKAVGEPKLMGDYEPGVPNNPLLKNWQELSIKRALQEAVNSNAKYFAWINGPQTAARYNLSKEINSIEWSYNGETKQVNIMPKGASAINLEVDKTGIITKTYGQAPSEWKGKNVAEAIGKGLGDKIITDDAGALKGEGLNVGGEWATTLYDKQVPNIIKNLTGAEVKTLDMGLGISDMKDDLAFIEKGKNNKYIVWQNEEPQSQFDTEELAQKEVDKLNKNLITKSTQQAIELTPEVKAIINGEARQIAKPSGKLPFAEQMTAPVMFKIKLPEVNTGSKVEDAKQILAHVEQKLGVSSIVKSIKDQELAVEIGKEVLNMSPMKELEPYVADAGAYKGTLPEVTGKTEAEIKKNPDFRGVRNEKAIQYAKNGDSIAQEIVSEYGMDIDSNEVKEKFEDYIDQKQTIVKQEKEIKKQKDLFKTTDTFKMAGQDKTLIGEITQTREMPQAIMEIMDQVRTEKKARREEVLNHKARPLMKYVDKKTQRLPKIGSKTSFGKEGEQILKDLNFEDVKEANKALEDYISKRNEFVNPVSRLALQERAAKFLQDKQKILEEVEKKIKAEGRDRKSKIEAIRDFFYMTEGEIKDVIGDKDYRLMTETKFKELLKDLEEKSIEIAQHQVAVSEVEWTIAQKELHRVENMQEVLGYPKDLNKLTTEQLENLNNILGKYERGDVFLGVREMETLAKNANLPDVKTQRQILEEVLGKRTGLPIEKLREIVVGSFDDLRSAVSLARQNAFYEVLVSDFYQLKIEAGLRYREIEEKTNELVKKARESRKQSWKQRLAPTDDMVIAYLEEGDLETKSLIAKDMSNAELELAHYVQKQYADMRDFLIARQQLEKERQNYYTHRPRGFFESWLRDGQTKTPTQFITAFGRAFKETFIDVNKMDEVTFKILQEQTQDILPLEKFFKYSMRRSGQLIPTKNLANAFLGYTKTFELKKGLDQYMPRMEAVARALTPTETTEGGVVKDTSLEKFVKKWINTQKGRPITVGPIQPGGTLDGLLRGGVAFTRFLDLALRLPAQFMSLVGEESATWINIGNKKYLTGQYRSRTKQGEKIIKKYESFVGTKFWDKMKEESSGVGSKLGETLFAFYGVAARNANIHHLLGVITKSEFESGNITPERLTQIKIEMNRWRADDLLHSVMGKTSVGSVFREHKSWAFPIINQTLSNLKTLTNMVQSGEYKSAAKSKEFGELFRATMLTLILVLTISKMYKDLKDKKDRTLVEELEYRGMNDAFSFISALSPTTLLTQPRLMAWIGDLSTAVTSFAGAMATGDRTASGEIPGLKQIGTAITPKLIKPLFTPTEEDKVNTAISTSTIKAQTALDVIKPEIVEPAQKAWDQVKKIGVGTEEADAIVSELADDEYEAYKLIKKADQEYWTNIKEKVTPIVNQAFKLEFGSEEANKLVENLSDDEYTMYKTVKSNLYGKGEATAQPTDWDKQSFLTHITNMAKGWTTDPVDAFNKLIKGGDWKITDIKNGQIIVDRMPMDASEKIKTEAAKNNANYKLDHIWSVKAGGGSDKNNLNIISTDEWEENTPVEVYLIKQLDAGNITGEQAKKYMVRFKIGRGQVTSGPLFGKYKTPITFEEIKKEIAK